MEVSKSEWKLFQSKIAVWQEAYMEKLIKEYIELLNGDESSSHKFWKTVGFKGTAPDISWMYVPEEKWGAFNRLSFPSNFSSQVAPEWNLTPSL